MDLAANEKSVHGEFFNGREDSSFSFKIFCHQSFFYLPIHRKTIINEFWISL